MAMVLAEGRAQDARTPGHQNTRIETGPSDTSASSRSGKHWAKLVTTWLLPSEGSHKGKQYPYTQKITPLNGI